MANMDIGMVGMAVMGSNLALNMADHGYQVACYNYTPDLTEKFVKEHPHENAHPFYDLKEFVASLKKPRKIMMMIMAGAPVDSMIDQLIPLLDKGDIIIDGGNSFFGDTMRRYDTCKAHGLNFFGTGISGGETGARRGPCIMPGGDKDAYDSVQPIFEAIAAKADGAPCCTYIGESGAGHFVKMVHNGIEYADMQLIAESYLLLKYAGGFQNDEIAKIFRTWNEGEFKSYLVGITADVLAEHDDLPNTSDGFLVDKIVDSAGQKGTGRWTSIEAMKEGVNTSLITAACNARVMSNQSALRAQMQQALPAAAIAERSGQDFIDDVEASLYTGKIAAYAQGFALYRAASSHYSWQLDYTLQLAARLQPHRLYFPRRLHHPGGVPRKDHGSLRKDARPRKPHGRCVLPPAHPAESASAAPHGCVRHHLRLAHPGARECRKLHRHDAQPAPRREPHPGITRRLWCTHVSAHRPRRRIPPRLAAELTFLPNVCKGADISCRCSSSPQASCCCSS